MKQKNNHKLQLNPQVGKWM